MKKDYMTRLECWARWMLPRQEADDVIADYHDIVGNPPRSNDELLRDVGKPRDVIKPLAQPKPYYTWLVMFVLMAACIFIPAESPLPLGSWLIWNSLFSRYGLGIPLSFYFIVIGLALSLVWFRPRAGEPKAPLPRSVIITLTVELVLMGLVWCGFYQLTLFPDGIMFQPALIPHWFYSRLGRVTLNGHWLSSALEWGGAAVGVVGIAALVKARTQNRRWRAVYFMSLSLMMLAFCVLNLFSSMDVSTADPWTQPRQFCLAITIIGLAGTGVSLC